MVWVQSIIYIPTICGKIGKDVELFNVSTYQYSILFNSLVLSIGRAISWGQRTWISFSPRVKQLISLSCRYSKNFWRNSYAHVILTSEADNLPTDTWQLLEDYGLVGCQSARSHDLSVHAKIDSTGYVGLLWASIGKATEFSYASIFEVKKLVRNQKEHSQICARKQLIRFSLTLELLH